MVKIICKWLILLILLCYTAMASIWAIDMASQHKISDININIANNSDYNFVTPDGVKANLYKIDSNILSTTIDRLDIDKIERALAQDNSYESVQCYISADNRLNIDITPMIPEIRIIKPDGSSYYINKDGKQIDTGNGFFVDVPIVSGKFGDDFEPKHILPVTRQIANNQTMARLITMVEVKSPHNILLYPRIKGQVINIGDTTDLTTKFDNLMLFYHKVLNYKGWETYDTISVKFRNQVVASRRDKSIKQHSTATLDSIDYDEQNLQAIEELESTQYSQQKNKQPKASQQQESI